MLCNEGMAWYSGHVDIDAKIQSIAQAAIEAHTFPGAVVGYVKDGIEHILPFGRLTYDADSPSVTADTIYDVASVTKSIPTSCIILSLVENGMLSFDDPIGKFIPELSPDIGKQVLIRHLLTFTAVFDLPGYLSTYASGGRDAVLRVIFDAPLKYPPGEHYLYSDIPPILLGMAAEQIAGKPLDRIADDLFFEPLGMSHTTFHPKMLTGSTVAPTEITEQGVIAGKAHDEKARAFHEAGYITGHAGLFSVAGDLLRFCQMLLADGTYQGRHYFNPSTIALMRTEVVNEGGYGTSMGWRTEHPGFLTRNLPTHVFGKEGFTGSLVLLDPDDKSCIVLLSNRTYPKRPESPAAIQQFRRQLLSAFFA